MPRKESFGAFVRSQRKAQGISLRAMADEIGVSAAYLSKSERGIDSPPTEDRIKVMAAKLNCDPDELLARAGRVAEDLLTIIRSSPVEYAALIRTTAKQQRFARR